MEEILVPIVLFLVIGAAYFFYIQARSKETLARIEKGLDTTPVARQSLHPHKIFTAGLFFIGISMGILFGYLGETMTSLGEVSYAVAILFFGGLSLIVSIFVKIKREEKNTLNG